MEKIDALATMEPTGLVINCATKNPTTQEIVCWNFIRIVEQTSSGDLLVCGINAESRLCYRCPNASLAECTQLTTNYTALAAVPQQYNINAAAAIFKSGSGDMLYGGGAAENTFNRFSVSADLSATNPINFELDTVTVGEGFIKEPTFIGRPFDYTHDDGNEYVFLIYRETALEYTAGTKVYPRIARVCKNDTGGTVNTKKFATFIKARLECSVPHGDEPAFEYDYIQDVVWDANNQSVYAVFTNQENGPVSSALCQYRMGDIMNLFDNGNFRQQDNGDVNALWTVANPQPSPRPGTCNGVHTTNYPPLLDKSVPSYNAKERTGGTQVAPPSNFPTSDPPILNVDDVRFTSLAVDLAVDSSAVYFVGTSAGSVIKFTTDVCDGDNTIKSVELEGFNANGPINGLELLRSADSAATFLVGTSDVQSSIQWPLNTKCQSARDESECALRYPYCNYTEAGCSCTANNCTNDPYTEFSDNVLTVFPNSSVSACLNDHVYWFCHLDNDNTIVESAVVTLKWDITESEEIKMTPISTKELVQLDVIVQSSTLGSYSCTADVGGRVVTKQVELSMKTDCLTRDNLCARMEEYNTLKSQNDALHVVYGNGTTTCSVKRQDCATVDLTCPTSP